MNCANGSGHWKVYFVSIHGDYKSFVLVKSYVIVCIKANIRICDFVIICMHNYCKAASIMHKYISDNFGFFQKC
jgi:hypothetical protein